MKKLKQWIVYPVLTALLCACLTVPVNAETILDPARESGKATEAGFDLDTMQTEQETLDDGTIKIWYLDDTALTELQKQIEDYEQRRPLDPQIAGKIARLIASHPNEAWYSVDYVPHPDIDGVKVATITFAEECLPVSYAGFYCAEPDKIGQEDYGTCTFFTYKGECNGDGAIDMKDVLSIRLFLCSWGAGEIDNPDGYELCDCMYQGYWDANNDDYVDMQDVLYLRKYIAGYFSGGHTTPDGSPQGFPDEYLTVYHCVC